MDYPKEYADLLKKANRVEPYNEEKAEHLRNQAEIVKIQAGATHVDKRKFTFNIKPIINIFVMPIKLIFSLFSSLFNCLFKNKKTKKKSKYHKKTY